MRETDCSYINNLFRVIYEFLRAVTCCCERFTILTDCYELLTEKSIRGQSSDDFGHVKQFASPFTAHYQFLRVVASCDELFTDTSELSRMLAIDYELAIRKDS